MNKKSIALFTTLVILCVIALFVVYKPIVLFYMSLFFAASTVIYGVGSLIYAFIYEVVLGKG